MTHIDLETILKSLCKAYKNGQECKLSKTRLTKLVFLLDWSIALKTGKKLTQISWKFDRWLLAPEIDNYFNNTDEVVGCKDCFADINFKGLNKFEIPDELKEEVGMLMGYVKEMKYEDFLRFVYSTYPIVCVTSSRTENSPLNLEEFAMKRRETNSLHPH